MCVASRRPSKSADGDPSDREADHRLQDELLPAREAAVVLPRDLPPVVADADRHREHRGAERHPDVPVREVREEERRDDDREVDEDAAHRRRARLGLVPVGPLLADGLPDLPRAQPPDEAGAEEDREKERHERRVRRAKRDVPEDAEDRDLPEERVEEPRDHRRCLRRRAARARPRGRRTAPRAFPTTWSSRGPCPRRGRRRPRRARRSASAIAARAVDERDRGFGPALAHARPRSRRGSPPGSSERGLSDVTTTSSASSAAIRPMTRALAAVAVPAAAEDDVHAPAGPDGASERHVRSTPSSAPRLVRVVDEDGQAERVRDAFEAAGDARRPTRASRRSRSGEIAERDAGGRRGEEVLGVRPAEERGIYGE